MKKVFYKKGFTLVELMVSIALFSIVILVAISAVVTIVDVNRKSQSLTSVMTNFNFAVDAMTRTIKTSRTQTTGTIPVFKDQNDKFIRYKAIQRDDDVTKYTLGICVKNNMTDAQACNDNDYTPILDPAIYLDNDKDFEIIRKGGSYVDHQLFLIKIKGYAKIGPRTNSNFHIQTSVSPRDI